MNSRPKPKGAAAGPALPRLLSVESVAEVCGVSTKTVRRWLDRKLLPVHRLGRQLRIGEPDLAAFLMRSRQP
ncbi:MAG TPA: helix-turn-helix domain-containing protein [Stellaceae bacterium]|nr:helix-turn-helix domain-containing protein [Stellaceae bacterium]